MYLLSLNDSETLHHLGIFDTEAQIIDLLESVDFITRDDNGNYDIKRANFPNFSKLKWKESVIPITSYTFPGEGDIYFTWQALSHIPTHKGVAEGQTVINNYLYENDEVEEQIKLRDTLKIALKEHFQKEDKEVYFGGLGSQDGEYLLVDGKFIMHIDPPIITEWEKTSNINELLKNLQ